MELAAADVNLSQTINASDALFVMKRYSGMTFSFPAGDYLYHSDTLIIAGNQVTNNIKMLCFGDVNASYAPTLKSGSTVNLVYGGYIPVSSNSEFDLPVKIQTGIEAGAISLGFYYPEEYLEITGAELPDGNPELIYHAANGLVRMAWCNLSPIIFGNEETVITLKMKTKNLDNLTTTIALGLFDYSEFADPLANVYDPVVLEIPQIQGPIGIEEGNGQTGFSVFPNPSTSKTTIQFSLQQENRVKISLFNQVGSTVKIITDELFSAGSHKLEMMTDKLPEGIYFLSLSCSFDGDPFTKTVKVVVIN